MGQKILSSRAELEILLNRFYERVREDELIGPIFNDVAQVDWPVHIKKIYNFWDTLLFNADNYEGRPFPPHIPLNLQPEHFQRWLKLFFLTVDESYHGHKADEIKTRALNIGRNFLGNLQHLRQERTESDGGHE